LLFLLPKAPSSFFKDPSAGLSSRILAACRTTQDKAKAKRKALQQLDPNVPPKKYVHARNLRYPSCSTRITPGSHYPSSQSTRITSGNREPTAPPLQPQAPGFLPADQWWWIQSFHAAVDKVQMETCIRCKERWFCMDLKSDVCHRCFNRDKGNKTTPFLGTT
jgi:hypothetical protein